MQKKWIQRAQSGRSMDATSEWGCLVVVDFSQKTPILIEVAVTLELLSSLRNPLFLRINAGKGKGRGKTIIDLKNREDEKVWNSLNKILCSLTPFDELGTPESVEETHLLHQRPMAKDERARAWERKNRSFRCARSVLVELKNTPLIHFMASLM